MMEERRYATIAVPDGVGNFAQESAQKIAVQLGESKEAWRGAAELASFIKDGLVEELARQMDSDRGMLEMPETSMVVMMVITFLEQYPTWPPGISDSYDTGFVDERRDG